MGWHTVGSGRSKWSGGAWSRYGGDRVCGLCRGQSERATSHAKSFIEAVVSDPFSVEVTLPRQVKVRVPGSIVQFHFVELLSLPALPVTITPYNSTILRSRVACRVFESMKIAIFALCRTKLGSSAWNHSTFVPANSNLPLGQPFHFKFTGMGSNGEAKRVVEDAKQEKEANDVHSRRAALLAEFRAGFVDNLRTKDKNIKSPEVERLYRDARCSKS